MSNIREYKPATSQAEKDRLKSQLIHHKRAVFMRTLLGLVIIGSISFVIYIQWKNKVYSTYTTTFSAEKQEVSGAVTLELAGSIMTYSRNGISVMDSKGVAVWNQTFEMQQPLLRKNSTYVAVADYNGRTIYLADTKGMKIQIQTSLSIKDFVLSKDGYLATILEDGDITRIYIYNPSGEEVVHFQQSLEQTGYPFALAFSPNSELLGVSYLLTDGEQIRTSVAFYNFGDVGQNENENLVSSYKYADTVVPYMDFLDQDTVVSVGDNRLMFYEGKQKPVSFLETILQEPVHSVFCNNGYLGLVFVDTTQGKKYRLDVYDQKGEVLFQKHFDLEYTDIIFSTNGVIIYNFDECILLTTKGLEKYSGTFQKKVQLVIPTTKANQFVLVGNNYINTVEFQ